MTAESNNRRHFLQAACSGGAALLLSPHSIARAMAGSRKMNLVFILVDDLGWADLGCYGSDLHETPNIDRFAGEGMRFTDAYAAAPVCTPTRASILTGKHPARLHMTVWSESSNDPPMNRALIPPITRHDLPLEEVTIAEVLKKAGYRTAHIGKWHLGDAKHYPETQGFDANIGGTLWGAPNTFFYPYTGDEVFPDFRYVPHLEFGEEGEYLTDRLTDEAIKILNTVKDGPFYLNLCYHTVHTPVEGKKELVDYYRAKVRPGMNHRNPEYAAMVHSLDENVGRVLEKIDDLGLAENTAVVLFSDNGGYINKYNDTQVTDNSPLRSGKGSLYEGGIRDPLIVRWPGVTKRGSESSEPVSSIDFYPTFLELLGYTGDAAHNSAVDGISIAGLLKNPESGTGRETLYWHYPHYYPTTSPVSAVREGGYKLLSYYEDGRVELYNLKEDIAEEHNLAGAMPGKARELKEKLDRWLRQVNAQYPEPNPDHKK